MVKHPECEWIAEIMQRIQEERQKVDQERQKQEILNIFRQRICDTCGKPLNG